MNAMDVTEHSLSDLLRRPKEVIAELERGDVLLRRRGLPPLRLTRADREDERLEAFAISARTLRNIAVHQPGALMDVIEEVFPWVSFLSKHDRSTFVDEFTSTVSSAVEFTNFGPLTQLVHEWRNTAEIHADPKLANRLRRPITPDGPSVVRP